METIKLEQVNTENISSREQIIFEISQEWDELFDAIVQLGEAELSYDNLIKIKQAELENIINIYKEQARPNSSLNNILHFLHSDHNALEKLAVMYKDIYYEPEASYEQNKNKSLAMAMEFIHLFSWPKNMVTEFKSIFK